MNRTKLCLVVAGVFFILTTVFFLGKPVSLEAAEDCYLVKIWDRDKIEPLVRLIKKNTCVVWVNVPTGTPGSGGALLHATKSDVLLSFPEAKQCVIDETAVPVGFKMHDSTNCFVAGWLRPGETASLVFTKPGTYKYNINFRFGNDIRGTTEGKIVVEE